MNLKLLDIYSHSFAVPNNTLISQAIVILIMK